MILKYRVSLPNIKGFARVYEVKETSSLYSLHKQMRADMDFPQDQVVLFKSFDADGNVAARYSVFQDFGFGTIDDVTAGQCHKRGEDKFIYFYDTTNVKSVIVTFEGVPDDKKKDPDDDDFEDDFDEDVDEDTDDETEEIYGDDDED